MEEVLFDSWKIETTERPGSWHEGFSRLLMELNGKLLEDVSVYPTAKGELERNPYDLFLNIKESADFMEIDDFLWSLADN
eukprot:2871346-Amphidinium_carterae.1